MLCGRLNLRVCARTMRVRNPLVTSAEDTAGSHHWVRRRSTKRRRHVHPFRSGRIGQASNDITVNSPITVSAGGSGGALTLQAGRRRRTV